MALGDPLKVKVGPGTLYFGPVGVAEPTDLVTPWATVDALWVPVGYTEEGHSATITPSVEAIEVAEELTPIRYEETKREVGLSFAAAEMTVTNIQKALNGGTITTFSGFVKFEPPELGVVTRVAIGWESQDGEERWVFRKCLQSGAVEIARRKAPAKATVPMQFNCEKPASNIQPFMNLMAD